MRATLLFSLLLFVLGSCAFNKLFLAPFPLQQADSFTRYSDRYADSLTLTFTEDKAPYVTKSNGDAQALPYTVESIFFPSESGSSVHAWFLKPKTNDSGKVLLFLHGNSGNVAYNFALANPFAEAGYQVFLIDYSGFGFSSGKATRKNVLLDANSALDFLLTRLTPEQKLIIYGQSLGGHLSAAVAAQNPGKFNALVMEGAFSSHKDVANEQVALLGRMFTREMYSAEESLPLITTPVLIIHSTEDETIPYSHGVRLYEVAHAPKSLYSIDKPHIRGPLFYFDSISARIDNMLK